MTRQQSGTEKSGNIGRAYEVTEPENTQLKQASNGQRSQMGRRLRTCSIGHRMNGTVQGGKTQDRMAADALSGNSMKPMEMARIPSSAGQSSGENAGITTWSTAVVTISNISNNNKATASHAGACRTRNRLANAPSGWEVAPWTHRHTSHDQRSVL
jgi:hypothetical protein